MARKEMLENSKRACNSKTDSKWREWVGDWIEGTQGTLMLVATVIATVTFQSIVNQPKYLTQDFVTFNTISFISALSIILLLISGLPLKNKVCAWLLTLAMSSTIIFMALTYMSVLKTVPKDHPIVRTLPPYVSSPNKTCANSSDEDCNINTLSQANNYSPRNHTYPINITTVRIVDYSWYYTVEAAYNGSIIALMGVSGFVLLVHTARCIYSLARHCRKQTKHEGEEV